MVADVVTQAVSAVGPGVMLVLGIDLVSLGFAFVARKLGLSGRCRTRLLRVKLRWCAKHECAEKCTCV